MAPRARRRSSASAADSSLPSSNGRSNSPAASSSSSRKRATAAAQGSTGSRRQGAQRRRINADTAPLPSPPASISTAEDGVDDEDGVESSSSPSQTSSSRAGPSSSAPNANAIKCNKCHKRFGKSSCTQLACFTCCDDDSCPGHREKRLVAQQNERLLEGRSFVTQLANRQRSRAVARGRFREGAFEYLHETLVVWSLGEFFGVPKWRDDVLRKSRRSRERGATAALVEAASGNGNSDGSPTGTTAVGGGAGPPSGVGKESSRRRFRRTMDDLLFKSIESTIEV